MELGVWSLLVASAIVIPSFLVLLQRKNATLSKRPHGPRGWPIVGNIFDLGPLPHITMYELRSKYGPLLWLKLCSVNTLVVQSPKAAAELFKNHDLAFYDRKCSHTFTALDYNLGTIAFSSCNSYWRRMKRLCSTHLFTNKLINETASLRRKCVDNMLRSIEDESAASVARGESGEVNLDHLIFLMSFNVMGNLALSRDLLDPRSSEGRELYDITCEIQELAGKLNVADYVPWLRWFDPQGMKRDMSSLLEKALKILSRFIMERVEEHYKVGSERVQTKDFLDVLLQYKDTKEDSPKISEHNVNIILLEMFLAGSGTTSASIGWAMAELLRDPKTLRKAREELDRVVGPNRKVQESDIDKLVYLQAVVKESLRLNPTAPLLIPHNTLEDTDYLGYQIPKNTQVLVNAYAIGRDPDVWDEPLCFKPERFLGSHSNVEYRGQNYELIPFGSGRRMCPGLPLAHMVLHLSLASLLHSFDWELGDHEAIDMKQRMGMAMRKLVPLKVIPKKRRVCD